MHPVLLVLNKSKQLWVFSILRKFLVIWGFWERTNDDRQTIKQTMKGKLQPSRISLATKYPDIAVD